tara:strand:- start:8555 stop:9181 length:627 start_codon:yes stop_codon:yes gene_type:complete
MAKEFYNDLIKYVSASDTANANSLLMKEVGKSLAKNKSDFVELLTSSGVPANDSMTDTELIDAFISNISTNKTLKISTAYMINKRNAFLNADGVEQVSDKGVKVSYKVMNDFFDNADNNEDYENAEGEEKSNFIPIGMIARKAKRFFKKDKAQEDIKDGVVEVKKVEATVKQKELESKAKNKKILIISGVSLLGLAIIGLVIYKLKNK